MTRSQSKPEILGVRVDAASYRDATAQICDWARGGGSRYVCCACVHTIMEAHDSPDYGNIIHQADLVTSDGMPLVWMLRWLGVRGATRVYGPDLMLHVLQAAARDGISVGFHGGSERALGELVRRMRERFPALRIGYASTPPFRPQTACEDAETTRAIIESGARIVFVGLGTPKQDRWMHAHRSQIPAVMVGVGAAFDFLSGTKPQAPRWMQASGFEWLFRLATEPRRLWKRYLLHNPRFAALAFAQILRGRPQ